MNESNYYPPSTHTHDYSQKSGHCHLCGAKKPKPPAFNNTPRADIEHTVVMTFSIKTIGTREQALEYATHARKFLRLQISKNIKLTDVLLYEEDKNAEIIDVSKLSSPEL